MTVDIDKLIDTADAFEPLPAGVVTLASALEDTVVELNEIAATLNRFPALATEVLRHANALTPNVHYAALEEALPHLDRGRLVALAVSVATQSHLSTALPGYNISHDHFWKHAYASLFAVEALRNALDTPIPHAAATAALLHDIGKVIIARHIDKDIATFLTQASRDPRYIDTNAEREVLEVHHGELGALLAQHWRLPASVARAIMYHHEPEVALNQDVTLCRLVAAADQISEIAIAMSDGLIDQPPLTATVAKLGFNEQRFHALVKEVAERLKKR